MSKLEHILHDWGSCCANECASQRLIVRNENKNHCVEFHILDKTQWIKKYLLSEFILLGFASCFQKIEGKKKKKDAHVMGR